MNRRIHDLFLGRLERRELLDDLAHDADQDPVGKGHDLGQVRGDHDHRLALVGEAVDEFVDLDDRADVDAARRLVEDDQLRLLDQRLGDDDLLLIAARELDDSCLIADGADVQLLDPVAADPVLASRRETSAPAAQNLAIRPR